IFTKFPPRFQTKERLSCLRIQPISIRCDCVSCYRKKRLAGYTRCSNGEPPELLVWDIPPSESSTNPMLLFSGQKPQLFHNTDELRFQRHRCLEKVIAP